MTVCFVFIMNVYFTFCVYYFTKLIKAYNAIYLKLNLLFLSRVGGINPGLSIKP